MTKLCPIILIAALALAGMATDLHAQQPPPATGFSFFDDLISNEIESQWGKGKRDTNPSSYAHAATLTEQRANCAAGNRTACLHLERYTWHADACRNEYYPENCDDALKYPFAERQSLTLAQQVNQRYRYDSNLCRDKDDRAACERADASPMAKIPRIAQHLANLAKRSGSTNSDSAMSGISA